ncbi:MAG: hypothetical protein K1X85_07280 [Ignavibacteria bacterium]|nr:hypothetical protein [Ignavibacteria bacterium]
MKKQDYNNHKQYVPGFHFVSFGFLMAAFALSVWNLIGGEGELTGRITFLLITIYLMLTFFYFRVFALKAQDRAIRAEESLRYYLLTGRRLPEGLSMNQIVALRFASDDELPNLTEEAVASGLAGNDIKKKISAWREDNHRA